MIMVSLEISLWQQEIQRPLQFCQISDFKSQIKLSNKCCLQLSYTFKTLNSILHCNPSSDTPDTGLSLANHSFNCSMTRLNTSALHFPCYIRATFSPSDPPDHFLFPSTPPPNLSNIILTTFTEIHNLIFSYKNKYCELDCNSNFIFETLLQWSWFIQLSIICIINFSIFIRRNLSIFEQVIIHPLL